MDGTPVIETYDLTKRYAGCPAVQGLTFSVQRGEVVGLLGPNGAGKTTTMRILSCYLPASSGWARVAGHDVFTESEAVRRRLGYMPEHNPLPQDMRVRDYLRFRARLKGLSRRRARHRADAVIEQCGLREAIRKVIGHLSRGYRQRVGLADALVHEPELVILDEPTIGLDPLQIRQVRRLIKDLARERTVLLSTHILSEVEMTCSRVLILRQGRIVAADTTRNLQQLFSDPGLVIAEIAASPDALRQCWEEMSEVADFELTPGEGDYHRCALRPRGSVDLRPLVYDQARLRGWPLRELSYRQQSLEDAYLRVTGEEAEED